MSQKASLLFVNSTVDKLEMLEAAIQGLPIDMIHVISWDMALNRVQNTELALAIIDSQLCSDFGNAALQAFIREMEIPLILMPDDHTLEGVQQMVLQFNQPIDVMIPSFGSGMLRHKIQFFLKLHAQEREVEHVTQKLQGCMVNTDLLTQKVTELDAAKTEFLTGISRTVHATMNGVIGMLDIALDETVGDKVKDCLYTARSSANGLVAMMNDIVDISSIEAGEIPIERKHCSLSDILLDIDSLLQAQMIEREGTFDLTLQQPIPARSIWTRFD